MNRREMIEINSERASFYLDQVHKVIPFVDAADEESFDRDVLDSLSEAMTNVEARGELTQSPLIAIDLYSNFLAPDDENSFSFACDMVVLALIAEDQGFPAEMIIDAITRQRTELM